MGVVYTSFGPDKKPHIYRVPEGESPDSVAERHGIKDWNYQYAASEAAAKFTIANDPTGKTDWI